MNRNSEDMETITRTSTPKKILIHDLELADQEIARLRKKLLELKKENEKLKKENEIFKQSEMDDCVYITDLEVKCRKLSKENKKLKEEIKALKKRLHIENLNSYEDM